MSQKTNQLVDFAPLILFFVLFKTHGLLTATAALVITTMLSLGYTYFRVRRVAMMPLLSGLFIAVMGGLTLWFENESFIKMKPTIVSLAFAIILLVGTVLKKSLVKKVFSQSLHMSERGWHLFSIRWGIFFLIVAGLNEYVWRHYSTDTWVDFKVFGLTGLTFLFTMSQLPLIKRYWQEPEEVAEETP